MNEIYIRRSDGTVIQWQGAWVTATAYAVDDLVTHNGTAYICILAHTAGASSEPGVGGSYETYWQVFITGVAGVDADTIMWHDSYQVAHEYLAGDLVGETVSGENQSAWICILAHTGEASKAPTGASGGTYWALFAGGGVNGVSDLAAALTALPATTDTPDITNDTIVTWDNSASAWKQITVGNSRKRTEQIALTAMALQPRQTDGIGEPELDETSSNKVTFAYAAFVHTAKTYATMTFMMPYDYDGGTVQVAFGWLALSSTSNSIRMGAQARAFSDHDLLDQAMGTAQEVTDAATSQGANEFSISGYTPAITIAGTPAAGKKVVFEFYRDPTHGDDDLDESIYVTDIYMLYTTAK